VGAPVCHKTDIELGLLQDRVAELTSRVAVIDRDLRDARERLEELATAFGDRMDGVEVKSGRSASRSPASIRRLAPCRNVSSSSWPRFASCTESDALTPK
jgi:hypothetical protein